MGLSSFLRSVYDLDTLDTRFTISSAVPYKTVVDSRNDPSGRRKSSSKSEARGSPSKWNTPEFYLYYVIFVVTVPYMFWTAYDVSRASDPRYPKFEYLLSDGWIPGRKIVSNYTCASNVLHGSPVADLGRCRTCPTLNIALSA